MTTMDTMGMMQALTEIRETKVRKPRLITLAVESGAAKTKTAADSMGVNDLRDHVIAHLASQVDGVLPSIEKLAPLPENAGRHAAPVGVTRTVQNAIIDAEQRAAREEKDAQAAGYGVPAERERRFSNHASTHGEMRAAQMRRRKKNQRKNKRARSPWQNGQSPIPTGSALREAQQIME